MLAGSYQLLSEAMEQTRQALGRETKEALTVEVTFADDKFDENYNGLLSHIKAGLNRNSLPEYQAAAERLLAVFDKHGGRSLPRLSYSKQTATAGLLFDDLESEQANADLDTLQASQWLAELKADYEAFKTVFARREKERASNKAPLNATARKKLIAELKNFYKVIDVFHMTNQIKGLGETINLLNKIIDRAMTSARRYSGKKSDAEPEANVE